MATFRYLQPRQPGGGKSSAQNSYQDDPNGVYIPGRANRMDARPRNVLYAPGTGPGTKRAGIRTGIVNRDGSTSPVSSMGYRTGPLSQPWPTSLHDPKNAGAGAPAADPADDDSSNRYSADYDTQESAAPYSSTPRKRTLNPNAPLVYNPISLDNPGGNFLMQGATIADSSYMPEDNNAPQDSGSDDEPPRKRIDARPRNNIYMPGTGPGTGRTAIRIGTVNRDGSATPVSSMGYATGPLSQSRPSSLPPPRQKPAAAPPGAPPARPSITATAGMEGTLKSSSQPFGSDPAQQKLQPPKPLTPAVIPSSITLPSSSQSATAPNAIHSGLEGTLKTPTPQPPLGTPPPLDAKAPALSLTPSLGGIPTLTPSTGLDTLGGSSKLPGISTSSPSGILDVTGLKKRARGGPVRAGRPYLVGEEGPELIIPKRSGTVVPNHALQFSPLEDDEAEGDSDTISYHPAARDAVEPTRDDAARATFQPRARYAGEPARDDEAVLGSSFDEPQGDEAQEADDFENESEAASGSRADTAADANARPTTGLMLRPRPMPAEYLQQQSRRGQPSSSSSSSFGSFSNSAPTLNPDSPPATEPLPDSARQPGMPWDNRPPETNSAPAQPPGSRWLQKLQPPGARRLQAAKGAGQQQQGGGSATPGQGPNQPQTQAQQAAPPAGDPDKQTSLAKNILKNVPADQRLNTARSMIDAKVMATNLLQGKDGLRKWISSEAGFSKNIQTDLLNNYLNGAPKESFEMSPSDIQDCNIGLNLERSPEFQQALKANTTGDRKEWTFKNNVHAIAGTSATLGNFTAVADMKVTSQLVKNKDGKLVPIWKVTGTFTVNDTYDFDIDDKEALRAVNDMVAGVDRGPYQGRTQSGQLKTLLMSRIPGKGFKVTSKPVNFSQTSLQSTSQIHPNAGTNPPLP